uniref:phosphatidylinositol-3,4,5-trisphosphate 5-phosphatase n=1 Tax=Cyprinus carpio TaxID=7962 RepID=A0A8C2H0U6_CYPCA
KPAPWYHGNITRSTAEDLLSKAGKDGSFLLRGSESIQGAYALCVLYQNCVYTYRILPNEDKKLSVQASEGVPIRFFSVLTDLVEAYYKENMGLITHLQYAVQKEEEPEEEPEPVSLPPQLPPRNITSNESKDSHSDSSRGTDRGTELARPSISDTYIQRLQQIDISNLPEDHQKSIQEYFRSSLCLDAEQVQNGNPTLPHFKKLTQSICKNLTSEIARTLPSLEALQKVLDQPLSPGAGRIRNQVSKNESNQELLFLISNVHPPEVTVDSVKMLHFILLMCFYCPFLLDVEGGKVYFKKSKDGPEDKYFVHNKILQLVKSQKMHNRLALVVETEKEKTQRKEFVFDDTKFCRQEGFCQLLQQMKNKHSGKPEPDMITIFVGTWNMGNANPPQNITSWFQSKGQGKTHDDTASQIPHDIYVIGTQEDPLGEKDWIETVRGALRDITNISFKQIATQTLWSIRIVVLAKPEHENRFSHVFCDSVKTGIANALGNKGAVGVSFMFNRTSFGFVNSHLTSGSEKKLRRNQNFVSILRFLNLGDKKVNPFDITHRFTHLFWLGDLNYRVDLPAQEAENIVMKIKQQQYQDLLARDQLNIEREEEKVFLDYVEEEITFAPTYRFERDTRDRYAYTKAKATGTKYNLPSWCDRVLRKSYPMAHVVCNSYGCTNDIMTSDHSPVFATFDVGVTSQFVSKNDLSKDAQGAIKIMNCVAVLLTKSKTKFFIEYHSSCLEKFVKSPEGENQENTEGSIKVRFSGQLTPIIADPEYLLDQHILICIKSTDCDESYGEGCVALRSAESSYTEFCIKLTHHGERTGLLTGGIQLPKSDGKQTEKLYGECTVCFCTAEPVQTLCYNAFLPENRGCVPFLKTINPSYMGIGYKSSNQADRSPGNIMSQRTGPSSKDMTHGNLSPKKSTPSPTTKTSNPLSEDGQPPEMFDNPLYGSMSSSRGSKDHLPPPDAHFSFPKTDLDADRQHPVPTPRFRSFTCSETKPQPSSATNTMSSGLQPQNITKKPVVPSRSEGGMTGPNRPPVPMKSRPGQPQEPQPKPRDYRDSSELPSKLRQQTRQAVSAGVSFLSDT